MNEEVEERKNEAELEEEEPDEEIKYLQRQLEELEKDEVSPTEKDEELNNSTKSYSPNAAAATQPAITENSVHVGNLSESTTPEHLQHHFKSCGAVKRITILCDKWTGRSKGYAYMEFVEPSAAELALEMNESSLDGNIITVSMKRQNVPSFILRGRGRGGPFRGRGRGYPPRGRGYRGRGFAPY